jgi:hypothetical protein
MSDSNSISKNDKKNSYSMTLPIDNSQQQQKQQQYQR